ncbi:hypothetical protein GWI33_008445 [Rhynchophorus ferrugineus]|uniref:Uncharacterized protein n=1 Tax=Rhynchophorus ferrugineus TaxID=354439 RepID=A0A834ICX1_RHYFE|nr:hypothetical protein GWI33_008445 [Rhynchophorus ferrugineus]
MEKRQTRKKTIDTEQMEATEKEINEGVEANAGENDLDGKEDELAGLTMSILIGRDITGLKESIKLCLDVIKGRATKIHQASKKMRYGIGDRTVVHQTLQKIGDITDLMERKSKKQEQNSNIENMFTKMGEQIARMENKIVNLEKTRQTEKQMEKPHTESNTNKISYAKALQSKTGNKTTTPKKNKETTRAWTPPDKNKQKNELISFTNKTGEETKTELKKHITTKELQTGFKGIRVLKNGSVLVECKTAEQKKAVKERMQTVKSGEIKEGVRLNPRIKLIGLPTQVGVEATWTPPGAGAPLLAVGTSTQPKEEQPLGANIPDE